MILKDHPNGPIIDSDHVFVRTLEAHKKQTANQRSRNRSRRSTSITTEIQIEDHGEPFKQIETFFKNENITKVLVGAHKEYDENTFYYLHNFGLRVAVVSNQTCILSEIDAYNLKSEYSN